MKKPKKLRGKPTKKAKGPSCPVTGKPLGVTRRQLAQMEVEAQARLKTSQMVDELEQKNGTGPFPLLGLPMRLVSGAFLSMVPDKIAKACGSELLRRHVVDVLPAVVDAALGGQNVKKRQDPAEVASVLKRQTESFKMAHMLAGGWMFAYNIPGFCGGDFYGLSASLQPMGRGSTVEDWEYLGAVMGALGMPTPDDPSKFRYFTDVKTADPNSVLKWAWVG